MLLYRLTAISKNSRMLIAALLATGFHVGLMHIEFSSNPMQMPGVSLPRSVSILLKQTDQARSPLQHIAAEPERGSRIKPFPETAKPPQPHGTELPQTKGRRAMIAQPHPTEQKEKMKPPETVHEITTRAAKETAVPGPSPAGTIPAEDSPAKEKPAQEIPESFPGGRGEGSAAPGALQMAYPHYQLNKPPRYPELARKRNQQGTVILQVLVNREGRVDDLAVDVTSGFSMLDRAALAAAREWLFEPGRKGNMTIPMRVRVPVTFKLKN